MPIVEPFNQSAIDRAKAELRILQSNVMAKLEDGSELRAVWEGWRFVEEEYGEPFHAPVVDFTVDDRLPPGGFLPGFEP